MIAQTPIFRDWRVGVFTVYFIRAALVKPQKGTFPRTAKIFCKKVSKIGLVKRYDIKEEKVRRICRIGGGHHG